MAPGTGQAGQQRDQAHRVAAAAHALHAVVQPDRRRRQRRVVARQAAHLVRAQAAFGRRALGGPGQRLRAQLLPAVDMPGDVVVVQPVLGDQLVHQAQRQRAVGAGQQRQVLVALVRGLGLARVDADQLRALALGLVGEGPEMQVGGDRVAAPDEDQLRLGEVRQVHADLVPVGGRQRRAAGRGADGAVQAGRAQPVEEAARHGLALQQAHGAGIAVGEDGLRVARRDRLQAAGDLGDRLVPADALEARRFVLGVDALERVQHALRVVGPLRVARDLGAQRAVGAGMLRLALHLDDLAVLDGDAQGAGVGAVMRAGALHHPRRRCGRPGEGRIVVVMGRWRKIHGRFLESGRGTSTIAQAPHACAFLPNMVTTLGARTAKLACWGPK